MTEQIKHYAAMEPQYPLPELMQGAGTVRDPQTGCVLAIGVVMHRETYQKTGYLCAGDVPPELHACVCALLETVQDMPILRTRQMTPGQITDKLYPQGEPPESVRRFAAMALSALCQAFAGYVTHHAELDQL